MIRYLAFKLSRANREKKYDLFCKFMDITPQTTVLDVGITDLETSETDSNFLEKHYPYIGNITGLTVQNSDKIKKRYPAIKVVAYDGSYFPFKDNCFDLVWTNAVIEHVGNREKQLLFLKEIHRVAKRSIWVTTPNRYFPFELHTFIPILHWMPKKYFDKFLCWIGKKWAAGDHLNLLSFRQFKKLASDAGIEDFQIIKNRMLGFVVDFALVGNKV